MARVEQELAAKKALDPAPRANFTCVLCLVMPDGATRTFEGKVFGHLSFPPRGTNGFGYDPVFIPDGYTQTLGELSIETKQRLSHRNAAFQVFAKAMLHE
jgi:XTP/dITP diphosphohydrolase